MNKQIENVENYIDGYRIIDDLVVFYDDENNVLAEVLKDDLNDELTFYEDLDASAIGDEYSKEKRKLNTIKSDERMSQLSTDVADKEIILDPEWQREIVWNTKQKSLLIESIILGIPIPPLFFNEKEDFKLEVVDGKQRLTAISEFSKDKLRLTGLEILTDCIGKKISDLSDDIKRAFERATIRTITIKKTSDKRTKFDLFYRINSGSKKLTRQEIRNAMYFGKKNLSFVKAIDEQTSVDFIPNRKRGKRLEIISRSLAFTAELLFPKKISYKGRISDFINDFYDILWSEDELKLINDEYLTTLNIAVAKVNSKPLFVKTLNMQKASFKVTLLDAFSMIDSNALTDEGIENLKSSILYSHEDVYPNDLFTSYVNFMKGSPSMKAHTARIEFFNGILNGEW